MANTCINTLFISGETNDIERLANDLATITKDCKKSTVWVAELLNLHGYDAYKITSDVLYLRASICTDYDYEEKASRITLTLESAWEPPYAFMSYLMDKYENINIDYVAEESGCGVYLCSDFGYVDPYLLFDYRNDGYEDLRFATEEERDAYIKKEKLTEDDYGIDEYSEYTDWYEKINYDKLPKKAA